MHQTSAGVVKFEYHPSPKCKDGAPVVTVAMLFKDKSRKDIREYFNSPTSFPVILPYTGRAQRCLKSLITKKADTFNKENGRSLALSRCLKTAGLEFAEANGVFKELMYGSVNVHLNPAILPLVYTGEDMTIII